MNAGEPNADALAARLQWALRPPIYTALQTAVRLAVTHDLPLYLVGGPVRDLLLDRPISDLDLVVVGDAWPLAEAFAAATAGRITRHAQFRTAVVELPADHESFAIDFVTARRESYATPAALPTITPSTITDDLARRDFTINTLALDLRVDVSVSLLDPFDGIGDLRAGIVRALHDASFRDDPTRIVRAARFAGRLGFVVADHTRDLIRAALAEGMIARTSAQRIWHELTLTLDEPQPEVALALLDAWTALDQLLLVWNDAWPQQFAAARTAAFEDVPLHDLYFGLLIVPLATAARVTFARRYNLPTTERKLLHELPPTIPAALDRPDLDAVTLDDLLARYSLTALRVMQIVADQIATTNIARYIATIRSLPPLLTGDDLREHGIVPGPVYRTILQALRHAQLAGTITTREMALQWLKTHADELIP